ncbi:ATP phosphoribosyltransferase [Methylovirgula sp. 4M-Z18]|uniref:ATP phosphoribosyltransferase n=1 Tax=Methylovirgula sp. 4M-Z18 TaxID=2293567 RepID=UPI000E2FDC1D|nr:ATP phosphoribosyltransferase [Methylovirgula sp. 4M-Z18]RFB78358.1 ATP phosphoribosyltransferase [Methylovirgula sp. 4M-Z18]
MQDTNAPLVLAVPSKGRLQENAANFFARSGLQVTQGRGARDYRGTLKGLDGVEIAFLSASEIVTQLAAGTAHLGVTGEDLVRESLPDADAKIELLTPLGFGHANVVVAVPQAWIDVRTMADLEDVAGAHRARHGMPMRVATKYIHLTRRYFAEHHVSDYRIVESLGATEGAPAAGQAELIVDITTTGATLAANALKVLDDGVMLRSEANLAASITATWSESQKKTAKAILSRIAAEETARTTREVRAVVLPQAAPALYVEAQKLFEATPLFGVSEGQMVRLNCAKARAPDLADWLIGQGAEHVAVATLDYVFSATNPLYDRLANRI